MRALTIFKYVSFAGLLFAYLPSMAATCSSILGFYADFEDDEYFGNGIVFQYSVTDGHSTQNSSVTLTPSHPVVNVNTNLCLTSGHVTAASTNTTNNTAYSASYQFTGSWSNGKATYNGTSTCSGYPECCTSVGANNEINFNVGQKPYLKCP